MEHLDADADYIDAMNNYKNETKQVPVAYRTNFLYIEEIWWWLYCVLMRDNTIELESAQGGSLICRHR